MKIALLAITATCLSLFSFAQSTYTRTMRCKPGNSLATGIIDVGGPCGNTSGQSMVIADWTSGGVPHIWRAYLKFDLSFIGANAHIDTAYLSVFANPTSPSGNVGNPTWGTDNAVGIYRVTDAWDTTTLTWSTQPAMTATHFVTLPQSVTSVQDYTDINMTDLLQDMVDAGAGNNNGILFKHLQETTPLNSMIFYSPAAYSVDSNKVPRLYVRFTPPVAITDVNRKGIDVKLYPNPATGAVVTVRLDNPASQVSRVVVTDVAGRVVDVPVTIAHERAAINVAELSSGVYIVTTTDDEGHIGLSKLLVE